MAKGADEAGGDALPRQSASTAAEVEDGGDQGVESFKDDGGGGRVEGPVAAAVEKEEEGDDVTEETQGGFGGGESEEDGATASYTAADDGAADRMSIVTKLLRTVESQAGLPQLHLLT